MKVHSAKSAKGICAVMCIICMMFMLYAGTVTVYAQDTAKIVTSSESVKKGETVAVSFELSGNPGIWGLKFRVGYAHEAMTLESVEIGGVFAKDEVTLSESLDRDKFVFYAAAYKLEDVSDNGTLITLNFVTKAKAEDGEYPVEVELVQVINVDGNDVSTEAEDGIITIVSCFHKDTEIKGAVPATEEEEGYTGDTYCKECGELISEGSTIPKIEPEEPEEPEESEEQGEEYDHKEYIESRWAGKAGWQKISGAWYYFGSNGKLMTGWVEDTDGKWYYMDDKTGMMLTGWIRSTKSGLWYYMDIVNGDMKKDSWLCDSESGLWYYLDADGAMCTSWIFVDNEWYLLDENGAMCTGWNVIDGEWYLLGSNGAMLTGWQVVGDKEYYFDEAGKCLFNTTTPDGSKVDETGAKIK